MPPLPPLPLPGRTGSVPPLPPVARQDWIGAAAIIAIIAASICWRRATTNPHVLRGGCRGQGSSQQQDQDDRDCQLESFPMKH